MLLNALVTLTTVLALSNPMVGVTGSTQVGVHAAHPQFDLCRVIVLFCPKGR